MRESLLQLIDIEQRFLSVGKRNFGIGLNFIFCANRCYPSDGQLAYLIGKFYKAQARTDWLSGCDKLHGGDGSL